MRPALAWCFGNKRLELPVLRADWAPGTTLPFYVYHQMATGELYQIKCNAATVVATGLPQVACTQVGGAGVRLGRAGRHALRARLVQHGAPGCAACMAASVEAGILSRGTSDP